MQVLAQATELLYERIGVLKWKILVLTEPNVEVCKVVPGGRLCLLRLEKHE